MSGGGKLKMLHSHGEVSLSKDNLIFTSMEDVQHIPSIDLDDNSPKKKSLPGTDTSGGVPGISMDNSIVDLANKEKLLRNNSLNITKSKSKVKTHRRNNTQDQIQVLPPDLPDAIFTAKRQHQQNLILVQQQQQHQQKSILRNGGSGGSGPDGGGDSQKIDYETIEELEDDYRTEVGDGPRVVTVDEEVDGRSSFCCWGFREKRRLETVQRRKSDERTKEFARLQSLYKLEGDNKRILNLGWEELVQALQKRELSATAVLEAYISKTLEATSKYNNVTDFIPEAFAWAKELDSLPEPKGPLHGIPFCVKDDTNVKGLDTTLGYVKRLYNPAQENAVLVKSLMDLGCVPFCKTNVPQTLFTYGSDNPVFGATTNCINSKLSPGGSSSGTGSLVGSHGCPFGTGSDIGGSLRIPAHFNGVASIKPTIGRLSDKGVVSSLPNLMGMTAVPGIIGQTPSIVSTVFKGICDDFKQHKYDSRIPPIPWDNATFQSKEKLRIGYLSTLPYFPAMGDTEEVVLRAKSTLESLGHTLVPFTMPDPYNYMHVVSKFLLADQNQHFFKSLKGEKIAQSIQLHYYMSYLPPSVQRFLRCFMNSKLFPFMYSKRLSSMFGAGAVSSKDLWDNQGGKRKVIEDMGKEWERLELDAVISPLFPFPAPLIQYPGLLPMAVCYAMIWNLVDYPAGVVPFGRESGKNYDNFDDEGDVALKMAHKAVKESIGAPIGVQCIALPFKEEIVLRLLTELEQFSYKH